MAPQHKFHLLVFLMEMRRVPSEVRTEYLYKISINFSLQWLCYGPKGQTPACRHEGFVVDKVVMEQVFLRVLRFSPVSSFPPKLHTHLRLHVAVTRWLTDEA